MPKLKIGVKTKKQNQHVKFLQRRDWVYQCMTKSEWADYATVQA